MDASHVLRRTRSLSAGGRYRLPRVGGSLYWGYGKHRRRHSLHLAADLVEHGEDGDERREGVLQMEFSEAIALSGMT